MGAGCQPEPTPRMQVHARQTSRDDKASSIERTLVKCPLNLAAGAPMPVLQQPSSLMGTTVGFPTAGGKSPAMAAMAEAAARARNSLLATTWQFSPPLAPRFVSYHRRG